MYICVCVANLSKSEMLGLVVCSRINHEKRIFSPSVPQLTICQQMGPLDISYFCSICLLRVSKEREREREKR